MHKIDVSFATAFTTAQDFVGSNCHVCVFPSHTIFGKLHNSIIACSYDRVDADNTAFDDVIIKAQACVQGRVATVDNSKQRIDRVIILSLQGYSTVTTRSRLNGICQSLNLTFSFVSRQFDGRILYKNECYDSIVIREAGLLIVATVYPVYSL